MRILADGSGTPPLFLSLPADCLFGITYLLMKLIQTLLVCKTLLQLKKKKL
jgi:hypothetical protein